MVTKYSVTTDLKKYKRESSNSKYIWLHCIHLYYKMQIMYVHVLENKQNNKIASNYIYDKV